MPAKKTANDVAAPPKRRPKRPFTAEFAEEFCESIAMGGTVQKFCDSHQIEEKTVYRWLRDHEGFRQDYARAREARADARSERLDKIRDDLLAGKIDHKQARVAADIEKWQAGKEAPAKYGDRQTVDLKSDGLDAFFSSLTTKTGLHNDA